MPMRRRYVSSRLEPPSQRRLLLPPSPRGRGSKQNPLLEVWNRASPRSNDRTPAALLPLLPSSHFKHAAAEVPIPGARQQAGVKPVPLVASGPWRRAGGDGEGRGRGGAAAVDAGAGEPGVGAGEGGRGAAPGRVQGGGRRARRFPDGARVPHPLPRARPDRLLPARRLRLRAPRPGARRRRRGLPMGRRHLPRRGLRHLPPDGHLAGAQRHRPRAGPPGDQLPRRRLHRRPHARRRLRVAPDDLQPGLHPGWILRRAARARRLPRHPRVASRLPRRGGRERRGGRAHVALRRRPARQASVQDSRRLGHGRSQGAAPGSQARPRRAHVPDHRRAGDRGIHPLVRAQLLRHVAGARGVHALGDQRHHGALPLRHGARRALRRLHGGRRRQEVPQRRQDRAGADQLRVGATARRHPAARAAQRPVHRRRTRRRVLRHGLRHLLERLVHQQPHFRGDCAGEGEDDSLRTGQVFRSRVRVVRASHCWCSCRAGVWIQAGVFRHERGHGQRECGRTSESGLHGDRRAHGHLLPDLHLPLLHLPPRQRPCSEGTSDGIR